MTTNTTFFSPQFPNLRLHRNKSSSWIRNMLETICISSHDVILPLFVIEGTNSIESIPNMPDIYRMSIDLTIKKVKEAQNLGIPAICLFPKVETNLKTPMGKEACSPDNLINRTIKAIKDAVPDIGIISDVALDPYTSHGHDGVLTDDGNIDNDRTIEILAKQALLQAKSGVDIVAPSDMMDGRVKSIRHVLEQNNFGHLSIMSYAAKYASCFYEPFRDAVNTRQKNAIDKKTYQINPATTYEGENAVARDIAEGADMVIIKPGIMYLDIVRNLINSSINKPIFSYQVSGEYAMIYAAAQSGVLNIHDATMESMIAFKRAGCTGVITYFALSIAEHLAR